MNKIYKVIWSKVKHQYVVTSEFAHSCTKNTTSRVGKSAVAALAAFVLTAGVGGVSVQAADISSANQETLLAMQLSSNKDKNDAAVVPVVLDEQIDSTQSDGEEESTVQKSVQTDEGFYVRNGDKGTYNSLTKDGLWVGGTSNTTGFHVDNDGNIHTTGNAEVDGALNVAKGYFTVEEDGTTYVHANRSELQVTENQAVLRHADNSVIVNKDGVAIAGDVTADNGLKVGVNSYDSDGNGLYSFEVGEDGSLSAAKGNFTVDADGTTYVHANRSELQVTENQAVLRHADNGVIVNEDGVSIAGDFEAGNGRFKVDETGTITVKNEDGFASIILDTDGSILAGSHGNFQVTSEGVLSVGHGKFTVDQYGVVEANNVISKDMYVGSQEAENRVVTKGQLDEVSSDLSDVSEDLANVNSDLAAYEDAGITAGSVDEGASGAIAMGEGARVANGAGLPIDNAIAIGTNAAAGRNNAVAIGVNSNAAGENSLALGAGASTTANGGWNSVALGWGSIADESMVVSVGNTGENGQRRIVNVADGIHSTDAATVGQLTALQDGYKDAGIIAGNIAEEASGALAIGAGASIVNGANAAQNAIAIGTDAKVSINNAVAIGLNSNAAGENSMALGAGASTTAGGGWNSVALGNGSVADQNTVISIGNADTQRRITYVADGIYDTDAATVGQMNTLIFGSHSEAKTDLGLVNGADSLVGGINKNSNAIKELDKLGDIDWNTIQETATTYSTMQAKMANFESALSKLDVEALSEVSTMSLNPDKVQGSREPGEGGSTGGNETVRGENVSYSGNVSVGKDLTVNGNSTFKGTATFEQGADMNGQKITNVGDGAVEAGSKDAVNGGQLYNVQQDVKANSSAINSLGSRVSDLGDEIDSVGAISAALAGLHPLDYDGTGSKFQISAAMGTYDGTQAAAIGGFYHFNRDVMMSLGGATSFEGSKKTAANIGVTFRVGEGASGKSVSDDVMARLEAMDQKIAALEQENKELKNVLGAIDTSLSKEFPDVPANHWAYEAVTKLAGNDVVAGYPDGEFHGDRTMTRYEMAEIIYKAMSKGVQVDQKLVEEFKPEMEQVAVNTESAETTPAAAAETAQPAEENA
ncbi:ESPR-type extended signal peptide-containing protein [uncultured Megasphaera sp.]|uniref:ESPR-type extended signal peptide-containing protein n=1 Tax=uncultured Megasphaera sp. TaxID=165188 RepID=UPI0026166B5B|nr:ESPR-type extended signal peptide-containing protein [uncultured Megasphaera sp.]